MLSCVFIKEIICFYDTFTPIFHVIFIIIILCITLNNINRENKGDILTLVMLILPLLALSVQKNLINIFDNTYIAQINNYITNLNNKIKVAEMYQFMLSSNNIVCTFSFILNIVIVILDFCLVYELNNRLIYNRRKVDDICYSVALFILSCGFGTWLMKIIVTRF